MDLAKLVGRCLEFTSCIERQEAELARQPDLAGRRAAAIAHETEQSLRRDIEATRLASEANTEELRAEIKVANEEATSYIQELFEGQREAAAESTAMVAARLFEERYTEQRQRFHEREGPREAIRQWMQ